MYQGTRPYIEEERQRVAAEKLAWEIKDEQQNIRNVTQRAQEIISQPLPAPVKEKVAAYETIIKEIEPLKSKETIKEKIKPQPAWKKYAVPVSAPQGAKKIAVIIDDLGADRLHTQQVIDLPAPLTLAFLPYPQNVRSLVKKGRAGGHEIMMHMPMEPLDPDLDHGSYVLRSDMSAPELEATLLKNLGAFEGYVGINNHMGSRLTQDTKAMRIVMANLYDAGLLFVDSRTISTSIAEQTAADYLVPHAARDVFLDNDPTVENVRKALMQAEVVAKRKGQAIVIGHPKQATIEALQEWLPGLAAKGFVLVPASALVEISAPQSPDRTSAAAGSD